MAEEEQSRSEKATPWKLRQARAKGSVPKGVELGSFLALTVLACMLYWNGPALFSGMLRLFAAGLGQSGAMLSPRAAQVLATSMLSAGLRLWAGLAVLLMLAGAAGCLMQTGPVLSFTPITPDFKRLNPVDGLKRFFNSKLLFDTLRAVAKALLLAAAIWTVLRHSIPQLLALIQSDVRTYPMAALSLVLRLLAWCLLALIPIVLFDIAASRRHFGKQMMMSRREVRDEHKQQDGDPRIRSRRRALQGEARQRSASLRRVRDADVLITNPTRLAVALKYDDAGMPAPVVLAKGAGKLASLMREMAWRHRVPVVQNRRLARALFRGSAIDQPIAADSYVDVARVLIWLRTMARTGAGARA